MGGKIFYSDGTNIYLIADNYIKYDACPNSATQTIYINSDYKLAMDNVIKDYNGSESITNIKLQKLNNSFFSQSFTSTNYNMKSVAYMMDITAWGVYKDASEKADYAIGGPTIEMVMKSYNKSYGTHYITKAVSNTGYKVSKDVEEDLTTNIEDMLNTNDSLYVINFITNANGMWVASPTANEAGNLMYVGYRGDVSSSGCSSNYIGFRPVICLNSNVILQESNGTYTIQ